jgi:uncharacterized protein (DUF927 family)
LLKRNADLPLFDGQSLAVVQQAIDTDVSARLIYARELGWRKQLNGFSFGNEVIGGRHGILPPLWASGQELPELRCKGTLIEWRTTVAGPAAAYDNAILVITACFAAPLVNVANQANFGLNLFGLLAEDRAAMVSIAASVLGLGDRRDPLVATTGDTAASLQDARAFNDLLIIIDNDEEMGSVASYRRRRQSIKTLVVGRKRSTQKSTLGALRWRGGFF